MAKDWVHAVERSGAKRVILDYIDGDRKQSQRLVAPYEIYGSVADGVAYAEAVNAYCTMRKANRTFKFDRIVSVADPSSGEIIDVDDWIDRLTEGANFSAPAQPRGEEDAAVPSVATDKAASRWRIVAWSLLIGYLIGRSRVLTAVAMHFRWHWGLWL